MKKHILNLFVMAVLVSCNTEQSETKTTSEATSIEKEMAIQLPDNFGELRKGDNLFISHKSDTCIVLSNNSPSKLLEAIFDPNTNTFSILYVRGNTDTVGLDFVHPLELDSIVSLLNPNLTRDHLILPPTDR